MMGSCFTKCNQLHRALFLLLIFCCAGMPGWLVGQNRIGTGGAATLYQEHCARCHGKELEGGLGGPLQGDPWQHIRGYESMAAYIAAGNPQMGMPSFEQALSPDQIQSVVIFIREKNSRFAKRPNAAPPSAAAAPRQGSDPAKGGAVEADAIAQRGLKAASKEDEAGEAGGRIVLNSAGERFWVEDVVTGLSTPWSVAFLPNGKMLITEKRGTLRIAELGGVLSAPVAGTPAVWEHGQGGLLEVALHPDYASNGWVYLGYSAQSGSVNGRDVGMTKVVRGRIADGRWTDEEVLFEVPEALASPAGVHFGTRFVFQDGYLFFSMGDRGLMRQAQDLSRPNGKIHRIHDDGRVPEDNPFVTVPGAWPTIWAYGNRNAQGLAIHPQTGDLWEAEHGPRGGDEINRIHRGGNYGWPLITHGINYDGTPITGQTDAPGMEQPKLYWVPSIAVCGIAFYEGDLFPSWKHNLFAGGLASNELHRLVIEGDKVVADEIVLTGMGRIRDVRSAPDGSLLLVLNGPDKIVRLAPALHKEDR